MLHKLLFLALAASASIEACNYFKFQCNPQSPCLEAAKLCDGVQDCDPSSEFNDEGAFCQEECEENTCPGKCFPLPDRKVSICIQS